MNILITGGTGFIGRRLIDQQLSEGHQVFVLTRSIPAAQASLPSPVTCIDTLSAIADDTPIDQIINLAGEPLIGKRWNHASKALFIESRVSTTQALIDFIARRPHKPAVLVSASAIGYYGDRGADTLTESSSPGQEYTADLCLQWEQAAEQATQHGVRVCLLRIGVTLGADDGPFVAMARPFKWGVGGRLGHGHQWLSWIHVDDLVGLIGHLLQQDSLHGVFNGTAPQPVSNRTLTATLGKQLHRPAFWIVPGFVLRLVLGGFAHILLTGQKVLPKKALDSGFVYRYATLDEAIKALLKG